MPDMLHSALASSGVQAARIEALWWLFFWVTTVVALIVFAVLAAALRRASRDTAPSSERSLMRAITGSLAVTVVVLLGLLVASIATSRALATQRDDTGLIIEVTGSQWWWNVEYQHPEPEQRVRTANELHLPVGRTVAIKLLSNDVIHSFWVPSLHGKMDAIPGHDRMLWLRADRPGIYRGQCAEYCGLQHAHMAFVVIAEAPDDFERWIQAQRTTAPPPATDAARRGLQLVEQGTCAMCHAIRGTAAGAHVAPDLTHVASRATLAAGTLPQTREHLVTWISNAQGVKPGSHMPLLGLAPEDVDAIVTYLEGLR
jgi:cytochrome c oxidase subunit 2